MRLVTLTLGLVLAVGLSAAPSVVSVASAQDAAPVDSSEFVPPIAPVEPVAKTDATFDETLFEIPEGETGKFYIERVEALDKAVSDYVNANVGEDQEIPEALMALQPKVQAAFAKLVEKIALADDLDDDVSGPYFQNYTMGIAREGKLDELTALLAAEQGKDNSATDRLGWLRYLVSCVSVDQAGEKGVDELKAAIKNLNAVVAEDDFVAQRVEEFASIISQYSSVEGKAFFERTIQAFNASDSDARKALAKELEPKLRFFSLIGNEMIFEGVYDDGTEIDWKSYRGKVVLVDFWATWCPPCVGEVPNVLALYEKYHDAGFDVVGYSLDDDLDALEAFEKERNLPWRTGVHKLSMEANEKDGKNYTDLCEYYGIHAIPTMILVDKDGRVLDTNARGAHLRELLEKAFPDVK